MEWGRSQCTRGPISNWGQAGRKKFKKSGGQAIRANASSNYSGATDLNPSVVLIAPNDGHLRSLRRALEAQRATILREFNVYPNYAHLPAVLEADCDAFVVEIDSDTDIAMDLVEAICTRKPAATVMVYSASSQPDRMVRSPCGRGPAIF